MTTSHSQQPIPEDSNKRVARLFMDIDQIEHDITHSAQQTNARLDEIDARVEKSVTAVNVACDELDAEYERVGQELDVLIQEQ